MAGGPTQKAELAPTTLIEVDPAEIEAAALAIAFSMGRLYGAAKPDDKRMLRQAALAALYAAGRVRLERALKK